MTTGIKITPEMRRAGLEAFDDADDDASDEELVEQIYVAMRGASPDEIPPQVPPTDAAALGAINKRLDQVMATLDQLTTDVAAETTTDASIETLITGLVAQITAAGTDPVKLKALTDQMEANNTALQAAITANTPTPPPTPGA